MGELDDAFIINYEKNKFFKIDEKEKLGDLRNAQDKLFEILSDFFEKSIELEIVKLDKVTKDITIGNEKFLYFDINLIFLNDKFTFVSNGLNKDFSNFPYILGIYYFNKFPNNSDDCLIIYDFSDKKWKLKKYEPINVNGNIIYDSDEFYYEIDESKLLKYFSLNLLKK